MRIQDWMKQNIEETKQRLQQEEVDFISTMVHNKPTKDDSDEIISPDTNLYPNFK